MFVACQKIQEHVKEARDKNIITTPPHPPPKPPPTPEICQNVQKRQGLLSTCLHLHVLLYIYWFIGVSIYWIKMIHWYTGNLGSWYIDILIYWFIWFICLNIEMWHVYVHILKDLFAFAMVWLYMFLLVVWLYNQCSPITMSKLSSLSHL